MGNSSPRARPRTRTCSVALRKDLGKYQKYIEGLKLIDYRVRILNGGTEAVTRVLIDCTPDLRMQLLDAEVDWLDGVLMTHEHADHCHGIDDLRPLFVRKRRRLDMYLNGGTARTLRDRFSYCFEKPPGSVACNIPVSNKDCYEEHKNERR